jgi:hypothetical protein
MDGESAASNGAVPPSMMRADTPRRRPVRQPTTVERFGRVDQTGDPRFFVRFS